MSKKLFDLEDYAEKLATAYKKDSGIPFNELYNQGIYLYLLPTHSRVLSTEANFILQKDKISQKEILSSISRGLTWLKDYPIKNKEVLEYILCHFSGSIWDNPATENETREAVIQTLKKAREKLEELCGEVNFFNSPNPIPLCFEIINHWDDVWQEKIMYDALSCAIYISETKEDFFWYDGIKILKEFENEAIRERVK